MYPFLVALPCFASLLSHDWILTNKWDNERCRLAPLSALRWGKSFNKGGEGEKGKGQRGGMQLHRLSLYPALHHR